MAKQTMEVEVGWFQRSVVTSLLTGLFIWIFTTMMRIEVGLLSILGITILLCIGLTVVHFVNATIKEQDDWIGNVANALVFLVFGIAFHFCIYGLTWNQIRERASEGIVDAGQSIAPSTQNSAPNAQPQVSTQNTQPQAAVQNAPANTQQQAAQPVAPTPQVMQQVPSPTLPAVTGVSYNGTTVTIPQDGNTYWYRIRESDSYAELKADTKIDAEAIFVIGRNKDGLRVTQNTPIPKK